MNMKELFLAQLEREVEVTRKAVERVPEGHNDWKPHEKSMELGRLATLVATMPGWVVLMIERDELNLDDPSSEQFKTKTVATRAERLEALEQSAAKARTTLQNTTEEHLMKPWRLILGGRTLQQDPRHVVLTDTFCHLAHHRGQLTVYLRLNDASVPAIYGPSADEH
jgi:uncharacterized damage-inducible protein DinB